jgi:UDP-glucose 4-epimerase
MKKVVVYGGSGFVGSHVAEALTDADYQVTVFDTRASPYLRPDQNMIVGDVMDIRQVTAAAEGADVIYNFAAVADIDEASQKPIETANINIIGNLHVLEAARQASVERCVLASSVYVYSRFGSFYRVSKQAAEHFVEQYHEQYGLEYTILRYGSLYGRRADARNGIFRMLREALREHRITYRGNGDAIREYIHVGDAALSSVEILAPEFANRNIILSGQERMRIRDVMHMISEMMPWDVELRFDTADPLSHYVVTPYAYAPRLGQKLVPNEYVDLGQGLLDCLDELEKRDDGDGTSASEQVSALRR